MIVANLPLKSFADPTKINYHQLKFFSLPTLKDFRNRVSLLTFTEDSRFNFVHSYLDQLPNELELNVPYEIKIHNFSYYLEFREF